MNYYTINLDSDYGPSDDYNPDAWDTGDVEEPEAYICPYCNGSGEGSYDGSICRECKGRGEIYENTL